MLHSRQDKGNTNILDICNKSHIFNIKSQLIEYLKRASRTAIFCKKTVVETVVGPSRFILTKNWNLLQLLSGDFLKFFRTAIL